VKVRFTLRAAADLDHILAYIDKRSPPGARRVQARIQAIVDLIALHPQAGRITSRRLLRRVVVHPYPI
jgi:plasmid stabilization system protein ParE